MESVIQSQWLRLDQGQWLGLDQGKVSQKINVAKCLLLSVTKFRDPWNHPHS